MVLDNIVLKLFSQLGLLGGLICAVSISFSMYGTTETIRVSFNKFTGSLFIIGLLLIIYGVYK